MNFHPAPQYILVEVQKDEQQIGSIVLPDDVHRQYEVGVVRAVGRGAYPPGAQYRTPRIDPLAKVDDRVFFHKGDGIELYYEGTKYRLFHEKCLLGVDRDG